MATMSTADLIQKAREKARARPFNGDVWFVQELLENLLAQCRVKIPEEHNRYVSIRLVRELSAEEAPTERKLLTELPKWVATAKEIDDDDDSAFVIE